MKILFVCKHNRFRSRVAENYFKRINKNKSIEVSSAGLLQGFLPLGENQVKIAKGFGINILGKPRAMSMDLLKNQDKIIVVADDIPKSILTYKWYKNKVSYWKIPDVKNGDEKEKIRKIIKQIIGKVDKLAKQLN